MVGAPFVEEKMMSDLVALNAEARDRAGKGAARAARRAGRVPAVIYGDKKDPVTITVDPADLKREFKRGAFFSTQYEIAVGNDKHRVLPRDVQFHPVTELPQHVDFLRVSDKTRIDVNVPVHFVNEEESPGLKRGGVLNVVRHEVEVICAVGNIPDEFVIDLTGLDIGDSVHISAVDIPAGVEPTITDRDFTIATIAAPTVITEAEEEEEEEAEEIEGEETEAEEGEAEEAVGEEEE